MAAVTHLQKQLKELRAHQLGGFRIEVDDDIFTWTIWFSGPSGTLYHPGQYKAEMKFPKDFPYNPPEFRVLSTFWHPSVYPDGKVCISILHPPGTDDMNALETALMRWTPVQSIEKVLVSIVSLLANPDDEDSGAPANVDALVMYRKDRPAYEKRCRENAQLSLTQLPPDFVAPPENDSTPPPDRHVADLGVCDAHMMEFDDDDGHAAAEAVPFGEELSQIRAMGVGSELSDDKLLEMLTKTKGDVSAVIERLC